MFLSWTHHEYFADKLVPCDNIFDKRLKKESFKTAKDANEKNTVCAHELHVIKRIEIDIALFIFVRHEVYHLLLNFH